MPQKINYHAATLIPLLKSTLVRPLFWRFLRDFED